MSLPVPLRLSLRASAFLLLLALMLGANSSAYAKVRHASKHDAKREIELLEEQWRTAQISADLVAMDRLLSEDFIGISMSGQANTKEQQLDRIRNRKLILTKIDLSDRKIKLVGAVAIVTSLAQVEGKNDGESMTGTYRYTRVYQRLPSGVWMTTNFEATRVPANRHP